MPETARPTDRKTDFGSLATRYDELRPADELWRQTIELFAGEGDLRGCRVLDVGCGTGRLAAVLAEHYHCKVWGIDVSPEMLAVARTRVPRGVGLKLGAAEELPFADGWFERVTMTLVYHHVDPARALPQVRRVLVDGGRFAFLTFDPAHFPGYYLNAYFPSLLRIDQGRFRPAAVLEQELLGAGFERVRVVPHRQTRTIDRETALKKIRGRHISTFQLISEDEYRAGLEQAERELPQTLTYDYDWLIVVAER